MKYESVPNPVSQFYFWNRTRRHISTSSWCILARKCHTFAPYLDYQLYQFLTSLPAEYFLDLSFHKKAIFSRYPDAAHISFETKKTPAKKAPHCLNFFQLLQLMFYFIRINNKKNIINRRFTLPKIIQSILSPNSYYQDKSMYKLCVWLKELSKYEDK